MSDTEQRIIEDDFGTLTQIESARGGWKNWSRTIGDVTFMVHPGRKTIDTLLAFKAGGIIFKLNDLSDRVEVSGDIEWLPKTPEPLTDIYQDIIINWLYDVGLTGKERLLQSVSQASAMNRYNPIYDYLESLEWDGVDYFSQLMGHFKFDRATDLFAQTAFKKFLIGSIAKALIQAQNFMLVIDGIQGIGKSYLSRFLCPLPKLFVEGAIHPDDKDSYMRLIENWIWEVGELEGVTRKGDRAGLKDFITRQEITMRKAYGRYDIVKPATASLIGTINEDGAGFLNDPTGSRRFAVVKIIGIDRNYSKIDIDQLWAQLYFLYKSGESYQLEQSEVEVQKAINETYEADDPIGGRLRQLYDLDAVHDGCFVASIELLQTMKNAGMTGFDKANSMAISSFLKREKYEKVRQGGQWGFLGLKRLPQDDFPPI